MSCSLGSEQGLIASDLLGYGRDPLPPIRDVITDTGEIVVPIFSFPGGRRFHFRDPAGNELAVWAELPAS